MGSVFRQGLGWAFGGLLLAFGIGFTTYTGMNIVLDNLRDTVFSHLNSLPTISLQILLMLKVDIAISMLFSAYVTKAVATNVYTAVKRITLGAS
jgi:ABC-type nitrate/sulfonate/bicarbonate transport system permease component